MLDWWVYLQQLICQMRGGPVFMVKPKYIFKHPFNKYDLANPSNRQTQNQELTDYFNYGYNEDTMNIYGKLVKRFIEVLDHHKNLEYFNDPSELMRLNDQIPMDFGGFCKFHDPWIVDNQTPENFHDGQNLMRYFIMMIFANASRKVQYPLIQFITKMYKKSEEENPDQDTSLYDIIEQIGKNLEVKYTQTMEKIIQKANQAKTPAQKKGNSHRDQHNRDSGRNPSNNRDRNPDRTEGADLKKEKSRQKSKSSRHLSSEESSSSGSESEESSDHKKKRDKPSVSRQKSRKKEKRSKDEHRKKERRDKDKEREKDKDKDRNKSKKVKKEKRDKRSKSKDKKKKHH